MIDRFNFYDVYGYLLPGVLLFSFIWIPFGVLLGIWPPAEWSSAVVMLALAYVTGHILHSLSDAALPFEFRDRTTQKNKRSPSDLLFDSEQDQVLTKSLGGLRAKLAEQIKKDFEIEVKADTAWDEKLFGPRLNAFLQCRNVLVRQKAATYAEQQQGMYVLMRGAASAFLLSGILYAGVGLGLSHFPSGPCLHFLERAFLALLFLAMMVTAIASGLLQSKRYRGSRDREKAARCILFWLVAVAFFSGGLLLSQPLDNSLRNTAPLPPAFVQPPAENDPIKYREREQIIEQLQLIRHVRNHGTEIVWGWTALAALLALVCFAAYRSFAVNFALTIYRDYANAGIAKSAPATPD
jgi:uncharacterized membrane protein YfcA